MNTLVKLSRATLLSALLSTSAFATEYQVVELPVPLTDSLALVYSYSLSANNEAFWIGGGGDPKDPSEPRIPGNIYKYKNGETLQLTSNDLWKSWLLSNDAGQAVWLESSPDGKKKVVFFDGSTIIDLTPLGHASALLAITENGTVFWNGINDTGTSYLMAFNGMEVKAIGQPTGTSQISYDINDNGQIAWAASVYGPDHIKDSEIMFFDGSNTYQLSNNAIEDYKVILNNRGDVMWSSYDKNTDKSSLTAFYNNTHIPLAEAPTRKGFTYALSDRGDAAWQDINSGELRVYLDGNFHFVNPNTSIAQFDLGSGGHFAFVENDINILPTTLKYAFNGQYGAIVNGQYQVNYIDMLDDGSFLTEITDASGTMFGRYNAGNFHKLGNRRFDFEFISHMFTDNGKAVWIENNFLGTNPTIYIYDGESVATFSKTEASAIEPPIMHDSGSAIVPIKVKTDTGYITHVMLITPQMP